MCPGSYFAEPGNGTAQTHPLPCFDPFNAINTTRPLPGLILLECQSIHALASSSSWRSQVAGFGASFINTTRCAPASRYCAQTRVGPPSTRGAYMVIPSLL